MTESVTINSTPYDTYATVAQADDYLQAVFNSASWFALDDNARGQALVSATRLLDRQSWKGDKVDPDQPLAFPRTPDSDVPAGIVNGSIELAFAIAGGSEVVTNATPGAQTLQSIKAGSVSLSYFRGAEGQAQFNRFPLPVQELVRPYLAGQAFVGLKANGTDGESVTDDSMGYSGPL